MHLYCICSSEVADRALPQTLSFFSLFTCTMFPLATVSRQQGEAEGEEGGTAFRRSCRPTLLYVSGFSKCRMSGSLLCMSPAFEQKDGIHRFEERPLRGDYEAHDQHEPRCGTPAKSTAAGSCWMQHARQEHYGKGAAMRHGGPETSAARALQCGMMSQDQSSKSTATWHAGPRAAQQEHCNAACWPKSSAARALQCGMLAQEQRSESTAMRHAGPTAAQ